MKIAICYLYYNNIVGTILLRSDVGRDDDKKPTRDVEVAYIFFYRLKVPIYV